MILSELKREEVTAACRKLDDEKLHDRQTEKQKQTDGQAETDRQAGRETEDR
jgi:hypothetical protein